MSDDESGYDREHYRAGGWVGGGWANQCVDGEEKVCDFAGANEMKSDGSRWQTHAGPRGRKMKAFDGLRNIRERLAYWYDALRLMSLRDERDTDNMHAIHYGDKKKSRVMRQTPYKTIAVEENGRIDAFADRWMMLKYTPKWKEPIKNLLCRMRNYLFGRFNLTTMKSKSVYEKRDK